MGRKVVDIQMVKDCILDLRSEQEFCDRVIEELKKHGWGDFHYWVGPQDPAIVALITEHEQRRGGI